MPLLGMRKRLQIGQKGTIGHDIANDEVIQPLQGGQGQVGAPQVPLLGHEDEIETPNLACKSNFGDDCEPWGYVALVSCRTHSCLLLARAWDFRAFSGFGFWNFLSGFRVGFRASFTK